eukprot:scpid65952/ scgid29833/ 
MSVMASFPVDIWASKAQQNAVSATNMGMQQQCHFADRMAAGFMVDLGNNTNGPSPSTTPAVSQASRNLPSLQQLGPQRSFSSSGTLSPVATPSSSSLQSSPDASPAQTPDDCVEGGQLNSVILPRVMTVREARHHRRKQATMREAKRAVAIRKAFTSLEECIPGHDERSYTRLEILEQATVYINELTTALKMSSSRASSLRAATASVRGINSAPQQLQHMPTQPHCLIPTTSFPSASGAIRVDTPPADKSFASSGITTCSAFTSFSTTSGWNTTPLSHAARPQTSNNMTASGNGSGLIHSFLPTPQHEQVAAFQPVTTSSSAVPMTSHSSEQGLGLLSLDDLLANSTGSQAMMSSGSTGNWADILDSSIPEAVH